MYIKSIHFKNFGRHEDLKVELQNGLIGIVGPNGCGKSTITDGIYAALTNDFGRFDGKKEENITDTADPKAESFIELVVVHNDQELKILRSLRPNKSRLWIPGREDPFTKSGDIQREIEERLGISAKLLDRFCFVGQWSMFSFLSDTPGDRAKVYQQLCGTEQAQVICDAIGTLLESDDLHVVIEDNRDDLRQQIASYEKTAEAATTKARDLRAKLLPEDKLAKAEGIIAKRSKYDDDVRLKEPMQERIDRLKLDVEKSNVAVENARRLLKTDQAELNELDGQYEAAQKTAASCASYRENHARYAETGRQLSTLKFERETLHNSIMEKGWHDQHIETPDLDGLRAANARIEDKINDAQDRLDGMNHGDEVSRDICVRYHRSGDYFVDDLRAGNHSQAVDKLSQMLQDMTVDLDDPKLKEKYELLVATATEELDNNTATIDEIELHNDCVARGKADLEKIDQKIEVAQRRLVEYTAYANEPDEDAELNAKLILDKRKRAKANVDAITETLANEEKQLAGYSGSLESYQQQMTDLEARMAENFVSDDLRDRAGKAITRHRNAEPVIAANEADARNAQTQLEKLQQSLDALTARLKRTADARRFADRMKKIREEVLHRQALPQVVAQTNLEDMESDINEVLDLFGSPFWVETSDDLSFMVHFPGEPPKAANRLSGGQKGVLAVAFRVAINSLFKSEIGMMTLDEPTAGMDDRNVGYLAEALQRFAAQVRGSRQIIMITHADQLRTSFDQVVDFGDNKGGVSNHESEEVHLAVNG